MNAPRVPPTLVPTLTEVVDEIVTGDWPTPTAPVLPVARETSEPAVAAAEEAPPAPTQGPAGEPAQSPGPRILDAPVITDEWVERLERAIEARVVAQVGPMLNRWSGDLAAEIRRGLRDEIRSAVAAALAAERARGG